MENVSDINWDMGGNKNGEELLNTGKGNKENLHGPRDANNRLPDHPLGKGGLAGHGYHSWHSIFAYHSHLDICSLAASPSIRFGAVIRNGLYRD